MLVSLARNNGLLRVMTGRTHVSLSVFVVRTDIVEVGATGVARITARERFITGGSHAWALRSFFRNMPPERTEERTL